MGARDGHPSTRLSNGTLLAAGGPPVSSLFSPTRSSPTRRQALTATHACAAAKVLVLDIQAAARGNGLSSQGVPPSVGRRRRVDETRSTPEPFAELLTRGRLEPHASDRRSVGDARPGRDRGIWTH